MSLLAQLSHAHILKYSAWHALSSYPQLLPKMPVCVMQIAGAASIGTAESNNRDPNPANNALIAGLALQSLSFAIFLLVFVSICVRLRSQRIQLFPGSLAQYRWWLLLLLFTAVLVQLRTTFRLAESAQGVLGYLSTHEAFFGCLEFTPIALAVAALIALQSVRVNNDALPPHGTLRPSPEPAKPSQT